MTGELSGTAELVGIITNDNVILRTGSAAISFDNKNVGDGKSVSVSGMTLDGNDSGNYTISQPTGLTANITPKNLTVTGVTAQSKTYDGTTAVTLDTTSAAFVGKVTNDDLAIVKTGVTGAFPDKNAGTGKIIAISGVDKSGNDADNYTITQPTATANISPASSGLLWADPSTIIFGESLGNSQLNATASVAGTFAYSPTIGTRLDAGQETLSVTFTPTSANYTTSTATVTITVIPKAITVTADDSTVTYGTTFSPTFTVEGLSAPDTALSVSYSYAGTGSTSYPASAVPPVRAGTYNITPSTLALQSGNPDNYAIAYDAGVGTIERATQAVLTAHAGTSTLTFSEPTRETTTLSSSGGSGDGNVTYAVTAGAGSVCTISGNVLTAQNAGTCEVTATKAPGTNHLSRTSAPLAFTVNRAAQTITLAAIDNRTYGDADFSVTTSASSGLTVAIRVSPLSVCRTSGGTTIQIISNGTCTVTASQLGNDNYLEATAEQKSFTVARKNLTISGMSALSRTYDATTDATDLVVPSEPDAVLNGVVSGDAVEPDFSAMRASFATKSAGTNKPITVTGIALAGAQAGRYTVSQPTAITADIEQKSITVTGITVPTRAYDTTNVARLDFDAHAFVGVEDGDAVTLDTSNHSATYPNAIVGQSKTVTVAGLGVSGTDGPNYTLVQPVLQGTIIKAVAVISYAASRTAVYTGTPRVLSTSTTPAGLSVTTTYTGSGSTTYATSQTAPTVTGSYSVASTIVDVNYEGSASSAWSITKQPITVTIDQAALNPVFDGAAKRVGAVTTPAGKNLVITYTGTGTNDYQSAWPPTNAGTYTVSATVDEHDFSGSATATLVIGRANQATVSIVGTPTGQYGSDTNLVVTGGSGSGLYSFAVLSGPCTVAESTGVLTPSGTGECSVRAARAADTNYLAASGSAVTVPIAKGTQTVSFTSDPPTLPLVDTTYKPTATSSRGLSVTISLGAGAGSVCTMSSGTVTFKTTGTCTVTASQAGDSRWAAAASVSQLFEVGKLSQSIVFAQPDPVPYGGPAVGLRAFATSGLGVSFTVTSGADSCTVTKEGSLVPTAVGSCSVTVSQPGDSVYAGATSVTRTVTVTASTATEPHIASISAGDGTATVGYTPPSSDGGSPIISYKVSASATNAPTVSRSDCSATTLSCTLVGLKNGQTYSVTVASLTAAGLGAVSDAIELLEPNPTVDAPVSVVGTRASTTLDVTWDDPATFDPSTFQQYEVSIREADGAFGSPVVVSSLRPEVAHAASSAALGREHSDILAPVRTMAVQSRNARFTGLDPAKMYRVKIVTITTTTSVEADTNTAAAIVLPLAVPSIPRDLTLDSVAPGSVTVSWAPPLSNGGSAITSYLVTTSQGTCTHAALATRCTVTGIKPGDSVDATVTARNGIGDSAAVSSSFTMPGAPGAPTITGVAVQTTSASVTWSAPASNGGRAITSYSVVATTASGAEAARCTATGLTCELRALVPLTNYDIKVRATNGLATGAWSGVFSAQTARPANTAWNDYRAQTGLANSGLKSAAIVALPPSPAKVSTMSVGSSRTRVVATRRAADVTIPVTQAIISVTSKSGKLIARIKVQVDPSNPETSVSVPYASSKIKVKVQFANAYGVSAGGAAGVNIAEGNTFDSTVVSNQVRVVGTEVTPYAYFSRGSAVLTPAGRKAVALAATTVRTRGGLVYVSGFATRDELRSAWLVQSLARLRAETVAKELSRLGVRQWIYFAGTAAGGNAWDPSRARRVVVSTDTVINQA